MIKILDCKSSNYLSRLKLILEKIRFTSKINTDVVTKIVNDHNSLIAFNSVSDGAKIEITIPKYYE